MQYPKLLVSALKLASHCADAVLATADKASAIKNVSSVFISINLLNGKIELPGTKVE